MKRFSETIFALAAYLMLVSGVQAAEFTPLGALLSGDGFLSLPRGISADGSVVVGGSFSASGFVAFRWTASTGMVELGDLSGGIVESEAFGVSADGSVVVGRGRSALGPEAFRWTADTGMVGLGDLPGGSFNSVANSVSADGSVVVGVSNSTSGDDEAFIWTSEGSIMVGLGDLTCGELHGSTSQAQAVSADGKVVVGVSAIGSNREAFRWTSGGGMKGLGGLTDFDCFFSNSQAFGVSADGSAVVGYSALEAFRWTDGTGTVGLGDLPGGFVESYAWGISADGSVVVGTSSSSLCCQEAFVWTQANGMQNLRDMLVANGATGLTGWTLDQAVGISADGQTIVGFGINPRGDTEAWVATLSRFNDVPPDHWASSFIETLADSGITSGCGNNKYCPDGSVTRAQMAVFLERGINGSGFSPPTASGNVFLDVSALSFAASFIEQFALDGITAGCGNNNYCPDGEVTRDQMAVFLLRAKHGAGFSPPPATGVFTDVALSHWAVHWIEQLAAEGITAGCGNGNYCPDTVVTRDQMAVFLVRTFGL